MMRCRWCCECAQPQSRFRPRLKLPWQAAPPTAPPRRATLAQATLVGASAP